MVETHPSLVGAGPAQTPVRPPALPPSATRVPLPVALFLRGFCRRRRARSVRAHRPPVRAHASSSSFDPALRPASDGSEPKPYVCYFGKDCCASGAA